MKTHLPAVSCQLLTSPSGLSNRLKAQSRENLPEIEAFLHSQETGSKK